MKFKDYISKNKTDKYSPKKIINFIIFGGSIGILSSIIFASFADLRNIGETLSKTNSLYIFIAFCLVALSFFIKPLSAVLLAQKMHLNIRKYDVYNISLTEAFFNGITPGASGGQPFQAYAFTRFGVSGSRSTGLLLANMLSQMIGANILAFLSLFFYSRFADNKPYFVSLVVIGFSFSFGMLALFFIIAISKKAKKFIISLFKILAKIKFLKKIIEKNLIKIETFIDEMQDAFKLIIKMKSVFLVCVIINLISQAILFSTTFFIIKSLNNNIEYSDFIFVMLSTAFAVNVASFVPTPGSSGGVEFIFRNVISCIFTAAVQYRSVNMVLLSSSTVLLWRFCTYFFLMLISFLSFLVCQNRYSKYKNFNFYDATGKTEIISQDTIYLD